MEYEMQVDKLLQDMKRDPFSTYPLAKEEIARLYVSVRIFRFILLELDRILADTSKPEGNPYWRCQTIDCIYIRE